MMNLYKKKKKLTAYPTSKLTKKVSTGHYVMKLIWLAVYIFITRQLANKIIDHALEIKSWSYIMSRELTNKAICHEII